MLVLAQSGKLLLLNATPEKYDVLDSRQVDTDSWAHLAIRGEMIYVRGLKKLHAFKWASKNTTPSE